MTVVSPFTQATEGTLEAARVLLAQIESNTASSGGGSSLLDVTDRVGRLLGHVTVDNPLDVSALATGAKQDAQTAVLTTLTGLDYASETTLASVKTTLDAIQTNTSNIKLDADHLSITSDAINLNTDGVEARLDSLIAKNYATETTLAALKARGDLLASEATLAAASAKLPAALVSGRLDVNLGASAVTLQTDPTDDAARLLGVVSVSNFPASNGLTDAQLRASAVPVSVSNPFGGDVTDRVARLLGHVTVDNASLAVTGPLTDTQLRASAVPVSGTVTMSNPYGGDVTDRTARLLGHVTVDNASLAVTQSGVWTVDTELSATGALATEAKQDSLLTLLGGGLPTTLSSNNLRVSLGASAVNWTGDALSAGAIVAAGDGVFNGTTWDRLRSAPAVAGTTGTGLLASGLMVKGTTNYNPVMAAIALTDADAGIQSIVTHQQLWNGASFDRQRNNLSGSLILASAARTATTTSGQLANYNWTKAILQLDVTAASGTGGLTVAIQFQDVNTGKWVALNATPPTITAVGTYSYEIGSGVSGVARGGITQSTISALPRALRIVVTHADASSYTYLASFNMIV